MVLISYTTLILKTSTLCLIYQNNQSKKCEAKRAVNTVNETQMYCKWFKRQVSSLQRSTYVSNGLLMNAIKCIRENEALAQKFI